VHSGEKHHVRMLLLHYSGSSGVGSWCTLAVGAAAVGMGSAGASCCYEKPFLAVRPYYRMAEMLLAWHFDSLGLEAGTANVGAWRSHFAAEYFGAWAASNAAAADSDRAKSAVVEASGPAAAGGTTAAAAVAVDGAEEPSGLAVAEEEPSGWAVAEEEPSGWAVAAEEPFGWIAAEEEEPPGRAVAAEEPSGWIVAVGEPSGWAAAAGEPSG